jgi:hypothetical protein
MENVTDFKAKIVCIDGDYFVVNNCDNAELMPITKIVDDGKTFSLPTNDSNRKWFNIARAKEAIANDGYCPLYYKESRVLGTSSGNKMPNAKLISYLSPEEQEEYKAIIARAIEAKNAAENAPKTEAEKLQDKIAKAQRALEKLMAQAANMDTESVEA